MAAKLQLTVPSFGMDETGDVFRIYRNNRLKEPFLSLGILYLNCLCGRDEGVKYFVGVYTASAEGSFSSW
jgi:hypothetical protein